MQSLQRGLDVLRAVKSHQPCALHQIHLATGLPKPTLSRILATLERSGVIFRTVDDIRYRMSAMSFLEGGAGDIRALLQEVSAPVLRRLCRDVAWPTDLTVRDGSSMTVLASNRALSPFPIKPSPIGHHPDMLLTAVGRAYLAHASDEEREEILASIRAEQPKHPLIRDPKRAAEILRETKAQGYGVRSETKRDGFSAIAVPIMRNGAPAACINLFYYASAVSLRHVVADHLGTLKNAATEIGARL
ncbi:MAG: IclR family transcriptional regulator C-terminal domain-containing protein [Parvibaculaceae bacterium]